jgi:hypothetical protein
MEQCNERLRSTPIDIKIVLTDAQMVLNDILNFLSRPDTQGAIFGDDDSSSSEQLLSLVHIFSCGSHPEMQLGRIIGLLEKFTALPQVTQSHS